MPSRSSSVLIASATLAAAFTLAPTATASDPQRCGTSPNGLGWNAPNGAAVFAHGDPENDPVSRIMQSVGEYRSHTMISHGASGWVTHSTAVKPGTVLGDTSKNLCGNPLKENELRYGYPGASQAKQGAIWQFLYSSSTPITWLKYQRTISASYTFTTAGATAADWAWNFDGHYMGVSAGPNPGDFFFRLLNNDNSPMGYSLYMFRNSEGFGAGMNGSLITNSGSACSTLLAHIENRAGVGYTSGSTYTHPKLQAALMALRVGVHNGAANSSDAQFAATFCANGDQFYWNVANQVASCMAMNRCDYGGNDEPGYTTWEDAYNDGNATGWTISPDRIAGWNGHPVTASIWGRDFDQGLDFNAPGNVYGCWN